MQIVTAAQDNLSSKTISSGYFQKPEFKHQISKLSKQNDIEWYHIDLHISEHIVDLQSIEKVVYLLDDVFDPNRIAISDSRNKFGITVKTWENFDVIGIVRFKPNYYTVHYLPIELNSEAPNIRKMK